MSNGTHGQLISSHSNWTKNFPRFFHANVKLWLTSVNFAGKASGLASWLSRNPMKNLHHFNRFPSDKWKALSTCVTSRTRFTDITHQIPRHHAQDSQTSRARFQTSRTKLTDIILSLKKPDTGTELNELKRVV